LRTNARLTPVEAVLRYRDLVRVEDLFRGAKAVLRTRPIFQSCDTTIRGHVFCSFLALLLKKRLDDLALSAGVTLEWKTLFRDLDRLQQLRIRHRQADWLVRTDALAEPGCGIPLRQDRPAAARQADRATAANAATQTRHKAPRPPEAECHGRPNFAGTAIIRRFGERRCSSRIYLVTIQNCRCLGAFRPSHFQSQRYEAGEIGLHWIGVAPFRWPLGSSLPVQVG
jgi:hypothetical protein